MTGETPAVKWVTPSVLTWERSQMGLTIQDVASRLKVSAENVHAWENGEAAPSLANLRRLAEYYFCPVGHFFLEHPQVEQQRLDFRGIDKTKTLSYNAQKRLRQFTRLMEIASDWLNRLGTPKDVRMPVLQVDRPWEAAQEMTRFLGIDWNARQGWRSPEEAFEVWRAAIERNDIFVFSLTLPSGEVRGASAWPNDGPPGILVNHSDTETATGRIFTLLHEFTHLMTRREGIVCDFRGQQKIETFANSVAAEVIAPPEILRARLEFLGLDRLKFHWSDTELDEIRKPFHASRDVIAISLEQSELANPGYYRQRRAVWDNRKFFGRGGKGATQKKPERKYRELGRTMAKLTLSAADSGVVSPLDLAEVLDMPLQRLPEFARIVHSD